MFQKAPLPEPSFSIDQILSNNMQLTALQDPFEDPTLKVKNHLSHLRPHAT